MHSEGYSTWFVCWSICAEGLYFSAFHYVLRVRDLLCYDWPLDAMGICLNKKKIVLASSNYNPIYINYEGSGHIYVSLACLLSVAKSCFLKKRSCY